MLKIRTIILSGMVTAILILTVQMVTAGTDSGSAPESGAENIAESQEVSAESNKTYNIPEYRSQFGECLDVSIAELAACRVESQVPIPAPLDECFDVSLMEVASCRAANQSSAP
ncbi:MAG: hypothetical protein C3F07_10800 [Anaerolineales bacterium]|nr:hypothetical protein [Anaerolineae bacterium]PWB72901.1 MAG: hypothetical protein C3F07_10800 [Anaerolineales bacterium]